MLSSTNLHECADVANTLEHIYQLQAKLDKAVGLL